MRRKIKWRDGGPEPDEVWGNARNGKDTGITNSLKDYMGVRDFSCRDISAILSYQNTRND